MLSRRLNCCAVHLITVANGGECGRCTGERERALYLETSVFSPSQKAWAGSEGCSVRGYTPRAGTRTLTRTESEREGENVGAPSGH
uniref:Uncharacterized protein n=1 Tax=Anguilla anguilla TaxID=7936 RepID=A0A0E9V393_ANGAN